MSCLQHIQQVDLSFNIFRLLLDFTTFPYSVQQAYGQSLRFYVDYYVLQIDAKYYFKLNIRLLLLNKSTLIIINNLLI